MSKVRSWGRLSNESHQVEALAERDAVPSTVQSSAPGIAYGMGRSYGDVCLNPGGTIWQTQGLDRFIAFDETTGILDCEAGVQLQAIQRCLVPRGWMLPVTPGTQLVSVGGAIANDVHGKNHHVMGTFGEHVAELTLVRTDGTLVTCTREGEHQEMLRATIGGLGLTGIITRARLQLRPVQTPWLHTDTVAFNSLAEFFRLADESESDWEYTVAWIDCLAGPNTRGIFMRANHASSASLAATPTVPDTTASKSPDGGLNMPWTPPVSLVNRLSLKPFNSAYYALNKRRAGPGLVHYESFFYPLDRIRNWNRMYGRRGFYQYQCVIPGDKAPTAIAKILDTIAQAREGSFLAVLKTFADRPAAGLLSFPRAGATLALDFPARGERTRQLFGKLDAIVKGAGGRLYPAKDACMTQDMFFAGYPEAANFTQFRDPGISSAMSRRLMGS